ncbi:MAG: ABC-type transport auxiliary lipoprotein family protein [Roseococcus sp.]|nr:ABC-type transport auxiliary lipoprotein family protein [Roseococcus sp.]
MNALRRALVAVPLLAGACSVLPERPFVEARRHPLAPARSGAPVAAGSGRVLLLRTLRAAPGLEARGLHRVRPDGTRDLAHYEEWLAPPAELAEQALREWLIASGLFAAVAAPGTRLATPLIMEAELTALDYRLAEREARAGLAVLLLRESGGAAEARVIAQRLVSGTARGAAEGDPGLVQAAAMAEALRAAFLALEAWLASLLPELRRA